MTRPKLLLADDSVTIRKVVELTFADEGIDVFTVADSAAAMSKFVEIEPDIVLVDVGLDEINGYRICEMIKQDDATKHIPVLLLVGSFEPFDQIEGDRVQADGFLTKPFYSIRDLVARVRNLLSEESETISSEAEAEVDLNNNFFSESEQLSSLPETIDIDELYNSSFANTAVTEELDTVEDILGDSGMDDEMIEASYPTEPPGLNFDDLLPPVDEEAKDQTKQFDWSAGSVISESKPAPPFANASDLDDTGENPIQAANEPENVEDTAFDNAPQFAGNGEEGDSSQFVFQELKDDEIRFADTLQTTDFVSPAKNPDISAEAANGEPSPEFVALVSQRVIEKLSDSVIREIAQDAVPRIAEKLIREALEEENKA